MKIEQELGFVMVTTVFMIVILALIGTFMVQTSMVTAQSQNLDLLQSRAYYAAKSGMEWLNYKVRTASYVCPVASTTFTLTANGFGGTGFSVTVTCSSVTFTDGKGTSYPVVTGTSTAILTGSSTSSINYVSQRITQVIPKIVN